MNKKLKTIVLPMLILMFIQMLSIPAYAIGGDPNIVSQGLFTSRTYDFVDECTAGEKQASDDTATKIVTGGTGDTDKVIGGEFGLKENEDISKTQELMQDMTKPALEEAKAFFNISDCSSSEAPEGSDSFFKQLMVMDNPVNITSNVAVMGIAGKFQMLAFIFAAVSMVFYAITYAVGQQKMDPAAFIIRAFVVLLTVYFLPYLMQDLLNLNNALVYQISEIDLKIDGGSSTEAVAAGSVLLIINTASFMILNGIAFSLTFSGFILFFLILLVIMIYQILKPIISLTIWWYFRMLMIFILTVIGPIMIIGMMLPQTSSYSKKWIQWVIPEIFSQSVVMLGFMLAASLLKNYGEASEGAGFIGFFILMYAIVRLLSSLPDLSDQLLGQGMNISGLTDAQNKLTKSLQSGVLKGGMNTLRKGYQMKEKHDEKKKIDGDVAEQIKNDSAALQKMSDNVGGLGQRIQDLQNSDAYKAKAGEGPANEKFEKNADAVKEKGNEIKEKTMGNMLAMLATGQMTKGEAKEKLAKDLMDKGLAGNAAQASMMAGQLIEDFEKQSKLGWDTQNEIGKLRANGDLTKKNLSDMIKADAQTRHGMTNPKDLEGHAAQLMNDKGFNGLVGDVSRRQEAIENLQNTNIGNKMQYDGQSVDRVDFAKKDNPFGRAMTKNMQTPEGKREAFRNIAAQGGEGVETNTIAGKETVDGKFNDAVAQGAVENTNNKMNYQGAVKNGKEGNYQLMYANSDGKPFSQASKDLSPIGSVIEGKDGNYQVTGHTQHDNGMVSMDVQKVPKGETAVKTTLASEANQSVMNASVANTVATNFSGKDSVGPAVSSSNMEYVGAVQQGEGNMQMVYKAQDGQTLNAGNMATSFASVGSVTTDGQGNYFQVTGHTDLGNNTAAMSLQQIQSPVNTEQMAQGFAQAVNSSGATSQYTAQVVSQGADGSAQVQLTRTAESAAIAGEHTTVPQITQGAVIDTGSGQAVVTSVSMSENGSQIMATVAPVQSIATNNFDTNAATQSMTHAINAENAPKFTAASVVESGSGGTVTLTGEASQVVASGNVASGGTVTLDNGRQAVVTSLATNDQGQAVVQYEYAPTNTEAVGGGLQSHFSSSGTAVSVVGAGETTANGASFAIQADSPSDVQGIVGSTFQSSDGAQMVVSSISQTADGGGYVAEVSYASVDNSSAAGSFVEAMNDTVVSSVTPTFETSSVTSLSGGGAVVQMTRNANDTSGYVPPTIAGDTISLPNGQEGIVTSVQMSADNNTFTATVAPRTETLGFVDTRGVAESVLSSSASIARSSYEYAGAATVDTGTNEVVAVFNQKPGASISDHSVAQSFVQPGKEVAGANGVTYIVQEVAQNGENVSVRMMPSTLGIQDHQGGARPQQPRPQQPRPQQPRPQQPRPQQPRPQGPGPQGPGTGPEQN